MDIILITGLSGSGKSIALNALEDAGFYCVDNLPTQFLQELVRSLSQQNYTHCALAVDARSGVGLGELPQVLSALRQNGHQVKVLFLTASDTAIVQRFSETRRRHPLSKTLANQSNPAFAEPTLTESIVLEREMLSGLEGLCHVLDTSGLRAADLRNWIKEFVGHSNANLLLTFESFAFKHGVPLDADLVFDVRMLPNPFYDPVLRPQTGKDAGVVAFLEQSPQVADVIADIQNFVQKWLPAYAQDNRNYLTVAVGCTGGQHRSVYCVEKISAHFKTQQVVMVRHRELKA